MPLATMTWENAQTRRKFLTRLAMVSAGAALALRSQPAAWATPLGLPLGIQLYSVREMLAKDYAGTLKQLAAIGYREVEAAGFFGHTPTEVKGGAHGCRTLDAQFALSGNCAGRLA